MNFRRDLWIIIVTIIYLVFCILTLKSVSNNNYLLTRNDLTRIDSVKMLNRAYYQYAAKSNGPSGIEFEDEHRNNFVITGSAFNAIDGRQLYDTLQYSNLEFSILTDKQGAETFATKSSDNIKVYDVIIGDKSSINLSDVNNAEKTGRYGLLIFFSVVYIICLIFYFVTIQSIPNNPII